MEPIIQLYTMRNEIAKDFDRTIKKVAECGFCGVEFAGEFGGYNAKELKAFMDDCGLYTLSAHVGFVQMKESLKEQFEFYKTLGAKYFILPGAPHTTKEEVMDIVDTLKAASKMAADYGMKVGYHNHATEFNKIDGKYILDIIAEETGENVLLQPDVYWVTKGGEDAVEYVKKWSDKIEVIHAKQLAANGEDCAIPDGIIDMKAVKVAAKNIKYFILEQESFVDPIYENITKSADYLKTL